MTKAFKALLVAAVVIAVALVVALPAVAAGNAGSTQVTTFDPTGATFPCTAGTTYTVTGGTVRMIFHLSTDASGGGHVTGTISPTGVTLTDGTTNTVYRLAGASWFGGNFDASGNFVSTDTEFFNILGPSGGPVAKVAAVEHSSSGVRTGRLTSASALRRATERHCGREGSFPPVRMRE
jgi:hypothetical protein